MLFNSLEFVFVFLPLVMCLGWLCRRHSAALFALFIAVASLVFYAWWKWEYLALILGSILANYAISSRILVQRSVSEKAAGRWLILGVALNLGLLGGFKYTNFFLDNLHAAGLIEHIWLPIALPLAISFFTFQQIAYLVDCRRGDIAESQRDFITYAAFVTFFPQLIAGPIVRHRELVPQFLNTRGQDTLRQYLVLGICIFCLGLFKKVCIADNMADLANPVFNRAAAGIQPDLFSAWVGTLAYSFQIYFDFSGYSDMAIGLGLMFGVRLPVNFWSPYRASCLNEFWRRWNITLGRFFRDYLYIPLGGGKVAPLRVGFNVVVVMFLSGLWHGAGWNFVLWGLLHGLGMVVASQWGRLRESHFPGLSQQQPLFRFVSVGLTFGFVCLAWVLFRSNDLDTAGRIYSGLLAFDSWRPAAAVPADPLLQLTLYCLPLLLGLVMLAPNTLSLIGVDRDGRTPAERVLPAAPYLLWSGFLAALALVVLFNGRSENFLYFIF